MLDFLLVAGRRTIRGAEFVSAGCVLIACVITFVNIVGRYFFRAPIIWAVEVMQFLMITGVFLGAPMVTLRRAHISMDMILTIFPERVRLILDVAGHLCLLAVAGTIIWLGIPVIMKFIQFDQLTEAAAIPVAIPQSVIPIGLFLMGARGRRAPDRTQTPRIVIVFRVGARA
jgi:TRAP-type C4-dicarboxylate transport system permease small subunit